MDARHLPAQIRGGLMNKVLTAILASGTLLVAAGSAWAGMASERISVSATVISTCLASSSAALSVSCSTASPITVTVNADTVAGGLLAARLMNSSYGLPSLYAPAAHLTAWADRSGNVASTATALTAMTGGEATYGQSFGDAAPAPGGAPPAGIVTVTVSY
jgi:spore coat protein U-like protein